MHSQMIESITSDIDNGKITRKFNKLIIFF